MRVVEPNGIVRVAALLPLSGRYRRWGDEVKRALERSNEIAPHVKWLFFDSEESRAVVASVIERAVNRDRVQAIVGPLEPDLATLASVRTRWHELPWFPLSSLPRALRHPLTFLWRLEAQDLAQGLASLICDREPREVYLLLDQRPRAQLTARHLLRRLRRCGVARERYQIISVSRPKPAALDEVVRRLFASDEFNEQDQAQIREQIREQTREQTVITLLREPLLSATLDALDRYDARARADRDQRDLEINVYAGLGARSLITRATQSDSETDSESSWITRAFALERSALSDAGQRALKRYPDLSTLALEALDLARWLERATRRAQRRALPLSRALNDISRIDGVWGRRVIKRGQLMPAPLRVLR